MSEKRKLLLMGAGTFSLLLGIGAYALAVSQNRQFVLKDTISMTVPLVLVVFMVFFIVRRYRDLKQGMPLEDERSKKAITKAAALSFYITIYMLLIIGVFGEPYFEDTSQATGAAILGMAILFFITWFYYHNKEKL